MGFCNDPESNQSLVTPGEYFQFSVNYISLSTTSANSGEWQFASGENRGQHSHGIIYKNRSSSVEYDGVRLVCFKQFNQQMHFSEFQLFQTNVSATLFKGIFLVFKVYYIRILCPSPKQRNVLRCVKDGSSIYARRRSDLCTSSKVCKKKKKNKNKKSFRLSILVTLKDRN